MNRAFEFCFSIILILGFSDLAASDPGGKQSIRGHTPQICLGFDPDLDVWGWKLPEPIHLRACPRHYAYFGLHRPSAELRPGAKIPAMGDCCRLPADDILVEEHVFAADSCPANYVATGGTFQHFYVDSEPSDFRCTKINTGRYELGPAQAGVMWGVAAQAAFTFLEPVVMMRSELSPAIRFGMGRRSRISWDMAGCVGSPQGSLLTEKLGKLCKNLRFRALSFRGREGDPPRGTLVQMFPPCSDISDIFDSQGVCIP